MRPWADTNHIGIMEEGTQIPLVLYQHTAVAERTRPAPLVCFTDPKYTPQAEGLPGACLTREEYTSTRERSLHEGSPSLSPLKDDVSDGLPVRSTVFLPKYNRYNSDPVARPVMWISKWIQGETLESLRYLLRIKSTLGPELGKPESQV